MTAHELHWMRDIRAVIYDLDGTLYEDTVHFDFYARYLRDRLPPAVREAFWLDWQRGKAGEHALKVGWLYDVTRDWCLRLDRDRVARAVTYDGRPVDPSEWRQAYPGEVEHDQRVLISVGDLWWMAPAMALHHGCPLELTRDGFLATRAFMASPEFRVTPVPGLRDAVASMKGRIYQVLATNSPEPESEVLIDELGLAGLFDEHIHSAGKPKGFVPLAQRIADRLEIRPHELLSVGDNLANDITPAMRLGARAIFIDRHDYGTDDQATVRVRGAEQAARLLQMLGGPG